MKRLLLPLLAALALPTALNAAEKFDISCAYKLEDQETEDEQIYRFIIDTSMKKGSLIYYEKPINGEKVLKEKSMVEYVNSPSQLEIIQDIGVDLGFFHLFDKNDFNLVEVKDVERIYGIWETSDYQTKYEYFDCKKTPFFF